MRRKERRDRSDQTGVKQTAHHGPPKDRPKGEDGVEVLAEGSSERAMHRRPVFRSSREQMF